jgi:hypothetical protein
MQDVDVALERDPLKTRFARHLAQATVSTLAISVLAAMLASGCADNSENAAMASRCKDDDRAACAKLDDARQVRDEADYQVEPALGYLNLPAGISLPMPVAAHASSGSSM